MKGCVFDLLKAVSGFYVGRVCFKVHVWASAINYTFKNNICALKFLFCYFSFHVWNSCLPPSWAMRIVSFQVSFRQLYRKSWKIGRRYWSLAKMTGDKVSRSSMLACIEKNEHVELLLETGWPLCLKGVVHSVLSESVTCATSLQDSWLIFQIVKHLSEVRSVLTVIKNRCSN